MKDCVDCEVEVGSCSAVMLEVRYFITAAVILQGPCHLPVNASPFVNDSYLSTFPPIRNHVQTVLDQLHHEAAISGPLVPTIIEVVLRSGRMETAWVKVADTQISHTMLVTDRLAIQVRRSDT